MKRIFLVTQNLLQSPDYVLDYNLFICHTLHDALRKEIYSTQEAMDVFREILAKINHMLEEKAPLKGIFYDKFLEIYPFLNENLEIGIIIVDQTDGSYPLILYKNHKDRNTLRISAFCASLREIIKKADSILPLIQSNVNKIWDKSLEEKIISNLKEKTA